MRLIDADALLLEWTEPTDWLNREQVIRHYTWWQAVLKTAPTIDAVPVVRCKYCKHSRKDDVFHNRWCQKPGSIKVVKDEFFCADGERKDDANDV